MRGRGAARPVPVSGPPPENLMGKLGYVPGEGGGNWGCSCVEEHLGGLLPGAPHSPPNFLSPAQEHPISIHLHSGTFGGGGPPFLGEPQFGGDLLGYMLWLEKGVIPNSLPLSPPAPSCRTTFPQFRPTLGQLAGVLLFWGGLVFSGGSLFFGGGLLFLGDPLFGGDLLSAPHFPPHPLWPHLNSNSWPHFWWDPLPKPTCSHKTLGEGVSKSQDPPK